ncbi:MAG: hypothetical protein A2149_04520 [Candidatus Schekmanbacteria bacterium RBG_16_38_11]|uniref:Pilus assembly protein PilO n=2 Tax=Bacteria candidate phyla TaxID=1783234 RepID=A0A1F7S357_9BACT|nr:MAG: Type IV pilus biogenesis protein PilO [Candidatus Gottesmanbacteria bacterium GW2011_GWC2_39_8]OGL47537.1 MAG: hypothetical protein A2149_04520 [Candidatus Schekmanbacteria bacterium RBG_16_38_11]
MKIKKIDIISIAVIGFILVSSTYIASLRYHKLKELKELTKALSVEISKGKNIRGKTKEMTQEIDSIKQRSKEFENQLPGRKNVEDFIVQINDIALKSGLTISGIRPQSISYKDLYGEVPIALNASASYPEVYNFFYLLKKIQRINKIESVTIKTQENKAKKCDVNMILKIFVSGKGK